MALSIRQAEARYDAGKPVFETYKGPHKFYFDNAVEAREFSGSVVTDYLTGNLA